MVRTDPGRPGFAAPSAQSALFIAPAMAILTRVARRTSLPCHKTRSASTKCGEKAQIPGIVAGRRITGMMAGRRKPGSKH